MSMSLSEIRRHLGEDGFCILPEVMSADQLRRTRTALEGTVAGMHRRGTSTHLPFLDPNANSVRVDNLPERDPVFIELLRHPTIVEIVRDLFGADGYVSNFTASIAMPGARSMRIHSDQALVVPPPWTDAVIFNAIWCLDDAHQANGATLYLPGSHRFRTAADVPADARSRMRPFEARAGSVIIMEGRTWHTSGDNVTKDERRALLFALYSRGYVRAQTNWDAALSAQTKTQIDAETRALMGMGPLSNISLAMDLIGLTDDPWVGNVERPQEAITHAGE